jgi:hypothetical protein
MDASPEEKMDRALAFLAQTDAQFADTRVAMLRGEYLAEVAENLYFKLLSGTVEDRKREAKMAPEVQAKMEDYFKCVREFEFLRARRKRAELTFEAARSINANRRQGGGNV